MCVCTWHKGHSGVQAHHIFFIILFVLSTGSVFAPQTRVSVNVSCIDRVQKALDRYDGWIMRTLSLSLSLSVCLSVSLSLALALSLSVMRTYTTTLLPRHTPCVRSFVRMQTRQYTHRAHVHTHSTQHTQKKHTTQHIEHTHTRTHAHTHTQQCEDCSYFDSGFGVCADYSKDGLLHAFCKDDRDEFGILANGKRKKRRKKHKV